MTWFRDDPILVLGMHRSGTTMLARHLDALGVFLGRHLEKNHESVAFLDLDDRILARAHASWDRPLGIEELIAHEPAATAVRESMRSTLREVRFRRSYLGLSRAARGLPEGSWGFKDPRATVTFPLWASLAPKARAIYMVRHGIDVAASLHRRATRELDDESARRFAGDDHLSRFASVRCLDLERAYELWRETHALHLRLRSHASQLPVLDVVYEDYLSDPRSHLQKVVGFLEIDCPQGAIDAAVADVRPDRALAHREDPALAELRRKTAQDPELAPWAL